MLRLIVLLLLLGNAAYFAWAKGLLAPWGLAPVQQSEPQRLAQQIRPQAIRILGREEGGLRDAGVAAATGRAQECLQAGLFEEHQVAGLKRALETWPAGSWLLEPGADGDMRGQVLKLLIIEDALRPRVDELRPMLNGKNLRPCR
jgi:hypothetical protein